MPNTESSFFATQGFSDFYKSASKMGSKLNPKYKTKKLSENHSEMPSINLEDNLEVPVFRETGELKERGTLLVSEETQVLS